MRMTEARRPDRPSPRLIKPADQVDRMTIPWRKRR
jgi:hypothetical protein